MAIKWRVSPETFLDSVEIERINKVIQLLALGDVVAIDSYEISEDGPKVSSVYLVSVQYLVEVRLQTPELDFDLCALYPIVNYRVMFSRLATQTTAQHADHSNLEKDPANPAEDISAQTAASKKDMQSVFIKLVLAHHGDMTTVMSYFGPDLDAWLHYVLQAYPITSLVKNVV